LDISTATAGGLGHLDGYGLQGIDGLYYGRAIYLDVAPDHSDLLIVKRLEIK
jgi:hypothetical protein